MALVPLCERLAPSAAAPALTDELRICVVQQLLSALSGGQRAPGQQEALLQWSAECVRGLQVCFESVYRVITPTQCDLLQACACTSPAVNLSYPSNAHTGILCGSVFFSLLHRTLLRS